MRAVYFTESNTEALQTLWKLGAKDHDWPFINRTMDYFLAYANEMASASHLQLGSFRIILRERQMMGFVVLNVIAEHLIPKNLTVIECGTYLLPDYRGQGHNPIIKTLLLEQVFAEHHADWATFAVPDTNHRAKQAMAKLPWAFHIETHDNPGLFHRFLKYKNYATNVHATLYSLAKEDFSISENAHQSGDPKGGDIQKCE